MLSQSLLLAFLAIGTGASGAIAVAGARVQPRSPIDIAGSVAGLMLALAFAAAGAAVLGV